MTCTKDHVPLSESCVGEKTLGIKNAKEELTKLIAELLYICRDNKNNSLTIRIKELRLAADILLHQVENKKR